MIYQFTIFGRPAAKKSRQQIIRNYHTGKPAIIPSKDHGTWEKNALLQVRTQYPKREPIHRDIRLEMWLGVYQGDRQSIDLDAVTVSVFDLLQKAGVVSNDYQFERLRAGRRRDRDNPRVEVTLREIT